MGVPQIGWFLRENPIKMDDDWGYSHLRKPQYYQFTGAQVRDDRRLQTEQWNSQDIYIYTQIHILCMYVYVLQCNVTQCHAMQCNERLGSCHVMQCNLMVWIGLDWIVLDGFMYVCMYECVHVCMCVCMCLCIQCKVMQCNAMQCNAM